MLLFLVKKSLFLKKKRKSNNKLSNKIRIELFLRVYQCENDSLVWFQFSSKNIKGFNIFAISNTFTPGNFVSNFGLKGFFEKKRK